MKTFVDRETEMQVIDNALNALQNDEEERLRTPIISFYGVEGIGKTAILQFIEQKCEERSIPYISIKAGKSRNQLALEFNRQISKYTPQNGSNDPLQDEEALLKQTIAATKALLQQKTAVLLMDSIDATNHNQIQWIEDILREIIEEHKLFVVLTSKRSLLFEKERSVARKLNTIQLHPLNRQGSEDYLDTIDANQDFEIRNLIFDWTRGYPLAMQVMVQGIKSGLDPRKSGDQQKLVGKIVEKVLLEKVLARVKKDVFDDHYAMLQLLSLPRRFNIVIMQELIEKFASQLTRESSLAYMHVPKEVNQHTDILNWDMLRAGFTVDAPVRHLFLLQYRIEQPAQYTLIHQFLAQLNQKFAREVNGSDRVRYLREYLYHSAHYGQPGALQTALAHTVQQMTQEPLALLQQFSEEFARDTELLEVLGESARVVLSSIHRHLAQENRRVAQQVSGKEQVSHLRHYLLHTISDPQVQDREATLAQSIEYILTEIAPENQSSLVETLLQDEELKEALGDQFEFLAAYIRQRFQSGEG